MPRTTNTNGCKPYDGTSDPIKIAYAAGLLDGEGTITTFSRNGRIVPTLNVAIQMTDIRIIEWMRNNFGGSISVIKRKTAPVLPGGREIKYYRQQYMWYLRSYGAGEFLKAVRPYMIGKAAQAEKAIALRSLARNRGTKMTAERAAPVLKLARQISSLNRTGTEGE